MWLMRKILNPIQIKPNIVKNNSDIWVLSSMRVINFNFLTLQLRGVAIELYGLHLLYVREKALILIQKER